MNSINDCYTLENGTKIPCLGFGTYNARVEIIWRFTKQRSKLVIDILTQHLFMKQNVFWDRQSEKAVFQGKNSLLQRKPGLMKEDTMR